MSNQYSKSIVNELSTNTQFLVTSANILNMEWNSLNSLLTEMDELEIPVKFIKGIQEWGQDFIKYIFEINNGGILEKQINLVLRDSSSFIVNSIKEELIDCKIFIENANQNTNLYNLQKGGNFCVLPKTVKYQGIDKTVVKLDPDPESVYAKYSNCLCLKIYDPNFNIDNYYGDKVFHLDEIFTIIPTGYGDDDFVIFFYKPFCIEDTDFQNKLLDIFQYNLNILENVFGIEKIILFDTEFSKGRTFNTTFLVNPPLFNRLLIRKEDIFYIYFPLQNYENTKKLNDTLSSIIYNFKNIKYKFIDTQILHNLGGNIHCAFKVI